MFLEFARYIKSSGKLVSGDICEWSCPFCTLPALSTECFMESCVCGYF